MLALEALAGFGSLRYRPHLVRRALLLACDPKRLMTKWFDPRVHMHHFARRDLVTWMEQAGFCDVQVSEAPVRGVRVYAIEGTKADL